jgi:hypothetical protein
MVDDFGEMEKEVSLLLVFKAMLPAEAEFLGDAGDAEGLAREARTKDIMVGDVVVFEKSWRALQVYVSGFSDITIWQHAVICSIGIPRLFIPIGCPYAFGTSFLEGIVKTTDSAEEVYEGGFEWRHSRIGA